MAVALKRKETEHKQNKWVTFQKDYRKTGTKI